MTESQQEQPQRPTCPYCGGTGQLGSFGGVSRFVISWEECFECCGTGYVQDEQQTKEQDTPTDENNDS